MKWSGSRAIPEEALVHDLVVKGGYIVEDTGARPGRLVLGAR